MTLSSISVDIVQALELLTIAFFAGKAWRSITTCQERLEEFRVDICDIKNNHLPHIYEAVGAVKAEIKLLANRD